MTVPVRTPQPLTSPTNKRLFAYSLVAGAGMLAAAQPAGAGVIYVDPVDVTSTNVDYAIDIDLDGTNDLTFDMQGGANFRSLFAQGDGIYGTWWAYRLSPSATVGPDNGPFTTRAKLAYAYRYSGSVSSYFGAGGAFLNNGDGYLGVRFQQAGNPLFAWVRLSVSIPTDTTDISYTIKDWAYEDTARASIHVGDTGSAVPEPGTLGMLALGSVALAAWRRRKKEQS